MISTSGCAVEIDTTGEVSVMYATLVAAGTTGVTDLWCADDGENVFAPGLSLNS